MNAEPFFTMGEWVATVVAAFVLGFCVAVVIWAWLSKRGWFNRCAGCSANRRRTYGAGGRLPVHVD